MSSQNALSSELSISSIFLRHFANDKEHRGAIILEYLQSVEEFTIQKTFFAMLSMGLLANTKFY